MNADCQDLSILFIGTQMATGGAQKVLLDQASWFHANGYQVNAAFLYDRDGLHMKWRQTYPFPIHNLEVLDSRQRISRQLFFIPRGLWRLWKLLRQNKFDVVETFTLDSNLFVLPLAWLAGLPVRVATNHGFARNDSRLKRMSHTWLINLGAADILVAVTEDVRIQSIEEGVRPGRVTAIPNGIHIPKEHEKSATDLSKALSIAEGTVFLLSVGRLVHEKAYEVLIRSMRIVVSEYPSVFLGIAGEGELWDELHGLIDELHLTEKVRLLGNREDVHALTAKADIFVMSSRSEGMPMALLEAMSFGLPVVVTRVGGLKEVVEDRSQGILVSPEDPQELAKAILELLRDPVLGLNMGKQARRRVEEKYTTERMCRQYEKIMIDLCREKKQ